MDFEDVSDPDPSVGDANSPFTARARTAVSGEEAESPIPTRLRTVEGEE